MLIIEIILTIFAWRKGWRWLSLIPVATAFSIGLMFGFSGVELEALGLGAIFIDILAIIALILMVVYPKKEQKDGDIN